METPLFTWLDEIAYFRGLPVVEETVAVAGRTFRVAGLKDAADLLDHEDYARQFVEEDRAPYGVELWPGAPMLAEHIFNDEDGASRAAIEIGCGLGLVSIAAATKGWTITATDNDPVSLRFAEYNAQLNRIAIDRYSLLDWTAPPEGQTYIRVFGADVLYDRGNHLPILQTLKRLLAADGVGLLSDPNRSVADRFASLAREHGFGVETHPTSFPFRDRGRIAGRIFTLRRHG